MNYMNELPSTNSIIKMSFYFDFDLVATTFLLKVIFFTFFETTKFQYTKFKKNIIFCLIPVQMSHKFLGIMDWIQFFGKL